MESHEDKIKREKINKENNSNFVVTKETDEFMKNNGVVIITAEDKFRALQDNCFETFKKKNHDYGNSFEQSMDEEGFAAMRVRGGDKWNRFKKLSKGERGLVNDESITDTLLDLANYCLMTVMWINKH